MNVKCFKRAEGVKTAPWARFRPLRWAWRRMTDQIDVTNLDLPVRGLQSDFAGLIACQVSDFHIDKEADLLRLENAVKIINDESPDIVFLTGDYFSGVKSMSRYIDDFRRIVAELKPPLGMFAIAGNHDHSASFWTIAQTLISAGVRVLTNENYLFKLGDSRMFIVGIDDLSSGRARPTLAFRGIELEDCTVVLVHNPDTAIYLRYLRPGVILSGHTHGGIIRLPVYGSPVRNFLRLGKQFYSGLNRYGDVHIYTNRGLGAFPLGFRINCRPEVSFLKLVADVETSD